MPYISPLPVCRALLLADSILVEADSHKKSLIGVYTRVAARRLPFRRVIHAYAQLADAHGEYVFDVAVVNLQSEHIVSRGEIGPVAADDPLLPVELVVHLPCRFFDYGNYELRLMHEGRVFASRVLTVAEPVSPVLPPDDDLEDFKDNQNRGI